MSFWASIATVVKTAVTAIGGFFKTAFTAIGGFFKTNGHKVVGAVKAAKDVVVKHGKTVISKAKKLGKKGLDKVKGAGKKVKNVVANVIPAAAEEVVSSTIAETETEKKPSIFKRAWRAIKERAAAIKAGFAAFIGAIFGRFCGKKIEEATSETAGNHVDAVNDDKYVVYEDSNLSEDELETPAETPAAD